MVFNFSTCHRTPSCWWRSSCTSMRCMCASGRRCVCSAASTCCALPGGAPPHRLTPDKWDRRREDWAIQHGDAHNWLELPTTAPTASRSDWEKDPNLQPAYNPMLDRICFLAEKGLTSMMVLHDYLSKHIVPLQEHVRPAWMYTGVNDTT
jgi:hypothetical protein